jgi:hypothetical protein
VTPTQVKQSSFFKTGNEAFIREVVLLLKPLVCLPGDFVVRTGDIAEEMFFISKGRVRVLRGKVSEGMCHQRRCCYCSRYCGVVVGCWEQGLGVGVGGWVVGERGMCVLD